MTTDHPESVGNLIASVDAGDEVWVKTAHRLGEEKGIQYTDYAKIRVEETRTVRDVDMESDQ